MTKRKKGAGDDNTQDDVEDTDLPVTDEDDPKPSGFGPDGRRPPGKIVLRGQKARDDDQEPSAKHLQVPMRVKAIDTDGEGDVTFSGWGSVFNTVDSDDEIIAPGAFTDSLRELRDKARTPALLWQHDMREPIGRWDLVQETDEGLYVEGRLFVRDIPRARQAARLLRERALDGLSIGFIPRPPATMDENTFIRTLYRVDLLEVSLVTFPALDVARVDEVKQATSGGRVQAGDVPEFKDLAEAQRWLRTLGLSRAAADAAVNGVKRVSTQGEPGELDGDDDGVNAIKNLTNLFRQGGGSKHA